MPGPESGAHENRLGWFLYSMMSGPLALFIHCFFEWLFFVTKPSMLTGLSAAEGASALMLAPLSALTSVVFVQLGASVVGAIVPARLRGVSLIPASAILGLTLLLLFDNFTYVLFGFGIVTTGQYTRFFYVMLLVTAVFAAGHTLNRIGQLLVSRSRYRAMMVPVTLFLLAFPLMGSFERAATGEEAQPTVEVRHAPEPDGTDSVRPKTVRDHRYPNILFLSADGLPAERLSVYGYERKTTPFLEELGEEWLFAENAFTNASRTHGALASMLTGKLPTRTRVIFPPHIFRGKDSEQHLPGLLKTHGYRTVQLGMRHYADAHDAGLTNAFDFANDRWLGDSDFALASLPSEKETGVPTRSEVVLLRGAIWERSMSRIRHVFGLETIVDHYAFVAPDRESPIWTDPRRVRTAVAMIEQLPTPWFMQIHLLDTHCCARSPRNTFFPRSGPTDRNSGFDGEIRDADDGFRKIIDALRGGGLMEETVIVITSDHTPRWTTTGRLPMMIRFPDAEFAGSISENVQLIDIPPTILHYLRLEIPEWMDGESLIGDRLDPVRPIFGIADIGGRESAGAHLAKLSHFGPPRYGVVSSTLIAGNRYWELNLETGRLHEGVVEHHTRPPPVTLTRDAAERLLRQELEASGFEVREVTMPEAP